MNAYAKMTIRGIGIQRGAKSTESNREGRRKAVGNFVQNNNQAIDITSQETDANVIGIATTTGKLRSATAHPAFGKPSPTATIARISPNRLALGFHGRRNATIRASIIKNKRATSNPITPRL